MAAARFGLVKRRLSMLMTFVVVLSTALACREAPTSAPPPPPSPQPTATLSPERVLGDAFFTITFDGRLLAREEIHVNRQQDQLLIFSEMRWFVDHPFTERRSLLVTPALNPQTYELEMSAFGTRSTWVAERGDEGMNCLNNNLAWYAPTLAEGLSPVPEVMIESHPSALPYALLALRYASQPSDQDTPAGPLLLHALDVTEDLPASRPLTVSVAPERKGAVIGTLALEGQLDGGLNPRFTLWVRPAARALYSVEIPDFRFSPWLGLTHPSLGKPGRLVIERVSRSPELPPTPTPGVAKRLAVGFTGADKTARSGTLILPAGAGPFPCIVLHSPGGIAPRWDPGDAFAQRGWAVFCYDKRGLGESKGEFDRDLLRPLAQDALLAAAMLRQRPELDPKRIVFLGLGEGGVVGALASTSAESYSAAVLGSCASVGPLFPALATERIRRALAPLYGWDPSQTAGYEALSLGRWQEWLFQGQDEVTLLRRRGSLRSLKEHAATDLAAVLPQATAPVLLLHGGLDVWTPIEGARALQELLRAAGAANVTLQVFDNLGADLRPKSGDGVFAPEVEEAIFAWLRQVAP